MISIVLALMLGCIIGRITLKETKIKNKYKQIDLMPPFKKGECKFNG